MKTTRIWLTILYCMLLIACLDSCSKQSDNVAPAVSPGQPAIDGTAFNPTTTKVTDTGNGLEILQKDASTEISIRLADKISGIYTIYTTLRNGRIEAGSTAVAQIVTKSDAFYGVAGTVSITVGADGKVSGTFSIDGQNNAGKTSYYRDGKISDIAMGTPTTTTCLVSKIDVTSTGGYSGSEVFAYNSDGKLIQRVYTINSSSPVVSFTYNYFWVNGHVSWMHILRSTGNTGQSIHTYQNNQLTKIADKYNSSTGEAFSNDYSVTYDAGGKITKAVTTLVGTTSGSSTNTNTYSYTGSNVTTRTFTDGTNSPITITCSLYDTKNNPYTLIANALSIAGYFPTYYGSIVDFSNVYLISTNNVGKEVNGTFSATYTYPTYNPQGYPTQIKEVDADTGTSTTYTTNFTYSGCK